jgi:hypothetical protein
MIIGDELRRPQKMMIMNFVWPITALYLGPATIWVYLRSGSKMAQYPLPQLQRKVRPEPGALTREQVTLATTHCGAGCALGDIVAEWLVFAIALTFAGGEFPTRLTMDLLLGWAFGIVFQYFTIVPMRKLSFGKGLFQAIRADTLAIIAFEVGLFAWMTLAHYVFFPHPHLQPTDAAFWFMMQIGMIIGFFTSYPANIFLLKTGWKEKMPLYHEEAMPEGSGEPSGTSHAA